MYCECVLHSKNEAVSILYLFEIQIALQVIDAVRQPAPKAPVGVVRAGLIACTASPHTQDTPPSPIARGLRKRPEHFRVRWRLTLHSHVLHTLEPCLGAHCILYRVAGSSWAHSAGMDVMMDIDLALSAVASGADDEPALATLASRHTQCCVSINPVTGGRWHSHEGLTCGPSWPHWLRRLPGCASGHILFVFRPPEADFSYN